MKSIMQSDQSYCYLCAVLYQDFGEKHTEEHHAIFGTANRELSERYGLKVYLCDSHHRLGAEAVHNNAEMANLVQQRAQKAFETFYPGLSFRQIFGKNYL